MKYRVRHMTRYAYSGSVSLSHNEVVLLPRSTPDQYVLDTQVTVDPAPPRRYERNDFFGNRLINFSLDTPHDALQITAESIIELAQQPRLTAADLAGPGWEQGRDAIAAGVSELAVADRQFVLESPHAPILPVVAEYAGPSFVPGRSLYDACMDLTRRIHEDFRYAPGETHIHSSLTEVLHKRVGVCQDFAHLAIACVRSQGLLARYVSGYLETEPPPGQPKLQGADASHAWFAVYFPGTGWVDFDPTNNLIPMYRHITLAWGRDYGDVTPVKGVLFGGGDRHELEVAVDVLPMDSPETV